jgi:glycosyltransferase involved in cell wall biosynthesis
VKDPAHRQEKTDHPAVSICIVTRNRKDELLVALASCAAQVGPAFEVLVFDGASTDGTEAAVRERFPAVRYFRFENDPGFPALRNRGYSEARGAYIVSLDDDAYLTARDTLQQLVQEFEAHPETSALAMPFLLPEVLTARLGSGRSAEDKRPAELRAFTGCAHAVRRDIALRLGPYREIPLYFKEDRDLSIRLLNEGHSILFGHTPPVVHLPSPVRDGEKRYELDVRSTLLFDYLNIPQPYVLPRLFMDAAQLIVYRLKPGALVRRLRYVVSALRACVLFRSLRNPVSRTAYDKYRRLPVHGAEPFPDRLPDPAT